MSDEAIAAMHTVKADFDQLLADLTPEEWIADSACPGWRVRDVVAHLGASAREVVDPEPVPAGEPPMPADRERQHDVLVNRRRRHPLQDVLEEYHAFTPRVLEMQAGLQREPVASKHITLAGLGTYPMHAIANALVFDYYCHLHHDLLAPGGPIERCPPDRSDGTLRAAVEWMMLGLPQMQGPELADALTKPVVIELEGPGDGAWTISRIEPDGPLTVFEGKAAAIVVRSDAHSFVAWGTKRRDWRHDCRVDGDEEAAARFLDTLNII